MDWPGLNTSGACGRSRYMNPLFSTPVWECLSEGFPDRWIYRGAAVLLPPMERHSWGV
jgi:hypothetical protein